MSKQEPFVLVVGGGPAGMAAALESSGQGVKTILIERENSLGGILNQCIHNGFGLSYFKQELTGPEYAQKFEQAIRGSKVEVWLNTFATSIESGKVNIVSPNGAVTLCPSAIVLAMGARERTAGNIKLLGTRPVGIYTAGQVQKMVNHMGMLPGKQVVILGSGDIGLIMARRLTLEGAHVIGVYEIMPSSSGLARNIVSCLNDYDIPLYLSTTIVRVEGTARVKGVVIAKVDQNLKPIASTEQFVACDCLLLSVGLVPENDEVKQLQLSPITKGAVVDETRQTNLAGVFSCGNVLQIHDLVDNACYEAELAGKSAAEYASGRKSTEQKFEIIAGKNIRQVVPQFGLKGGGKIEVMFRTTIALRKAFVVAKNAQTGQVIAQKYSPKFLPSELQVLQLDKSKITGNVVLEWKE